MIDEIKFQPIKEATREVILQYEYVRQGGKCNMFDKNCVQRVAFDYEFYHLVNFIEDNEYRYLLQHYSQLLEYYGIDTNKPMTEQGLEVLEGYDDEDWEDEEFDDDYQSGPEDFEDDDDDWDEDYE